jgi:hypothetical protein
MDHNVYIQVVLLTPLTRANHVSVELYCEVAYSSVRIQVKKVAVMARSVTSDSKEVVR